MKYVFIIGCPRSSTTWLQMLFAQHPAIATTQETHLFSSYIKSQYDVWENHSTSLRGIGVPAARTSEQFERACSTFARTVLDKIADERPQAEVVLEKRRLMRVMCR